MNVQENTLDLCPMPQQTSRMSGKNIKPENADKCCEILTSEHTTAFAHFNSICGYLHKTWTRLSQLDIQTWTAEKLLRLSL